MAPSSLADLLVQAVRAVGPAGAAARAVAEGAAARGRITGDEAEGHARLGAWLSEPGGAVCLARGAPASGTTTLLVRWLPAAAARGFSVVWVPLHRVSGLGTERAALALLCAALRADEPRLTFARRPETMWRWCARALSYDRDIEGGDSPLLVVIDGLHEAAGGFLERLRGVAPGDHVKLLLTGHDVPRRDGVRVLDLEGATPPAMRERLESFLGPPVPASAGPAILRDPLGPSPHPDSAASRLRALRVVAASPSPVPLGALRRLAGDEATAAFVESGLCELAESGGVRLVHGGYRALLSDIAGPFDEVSARADLGEACLVTGKAGAGALLADLAGEEWPSLGAAARLLEPGWLRARCRSGGGLFDAMLDVRRARAAAVAHLALGLRDDPDLPSRGLVPALRLLAECAVWEAVFATVGRGRVLAPERPLRWRTAALARSLLDAHAAGRPPAPRAVEGETGVAEGAPPSYGVLRRRWRRGVPEKGRALWVSALAGAGRREEAMTALSSFGPIPFTRAQVALTAAAARPDDAWLAEVARAAVLELEPELRPALVSVAPRAASVVLGLEATFAIASKGPEYRRLEAWTSLLPHLAAEVDRARAAREAFAAWSELPSGDDAEGAILAAAPWLPGRQALSVMDRLLAAGPDYKVKSLLSRDDSSGLVAHLPFFDRLAGARGRAAAWDALRRVGAALSRSWPGGS